MNTLRRPATALLFMFVTALNAIGRGGFRALAFDVLEIQSDEQHGADPPGDAFIDPLIGSRNTGAGCVTQRAYRVDSVYGFGQSAECLRPTAAVCWPGFLCRAKQSQRVLTHVRYVTYLCKKSNSGK